MYAESHLNLFCTREFFSRSCIVTQDGSLERQTFFNFTKKLIVKSVSRKSFRSLFASPKTLIKGGKRTNKQILPTAESFERSYNLAECNVLEGEDLLGN